MSLFLLSSHTFALSSQQWEQLGDIGASGLPVSALLLTLKKQDHQGLGQYAQGFGITGGATQAIKYWFPKRRPTGSSLKSKISGHTSAAFSAAAYLHFRYGLAYGVPSYLVASAVGYSRVRAKRHFTEDVVLGAALAIGVGYLTTSRVQRPLTVTPAITRQHVGLSLNWPW